MIKCRRRQATGSQKFKKIVNGRFLIFCWWKRKRLKNNRFYIPGFNSFETADGANMKLGTIAIQFKR